MTKAISIRTKIILERQIEYYMGRHWSANTDEDKDKYANLVLVWVGKYAELTASLDK
jgi:hypothetical protein